MVENVKALSFEHWMSLTQPNMDKSRYLRSNQAKKDQLHLAYNRYLEGWERELDRGKERG